MTVLNSMLGCTMFDTACVRNHLPESSTDSLSIAVFPSTAKQRSFSKVWTSPSQQATIFPKWDNDTPTLLNMQLYSSWKSLSNEKLLSLYDMCRTCTRHTAKIAKLHRKESVVQESDHDQRVEQKKPRVRKVNR